VTFQPDISVLYHELLYYSEKDWRDQYGSKVSACFCDFTVVTGLMIVIVLEHEWPPQSSY